MAISLVRPDQASPEETPALAHETDSPHPMVAIEDLAVRFTAPGGTEHVVLDGIDLQIDKGSFTVIVGPSGCGKTTLLRAIADLVRPSDGTVQVDGMSPQEARRAGVFAYVFQSATLFPWRTVLDNVCLPLDVTRYPSRGQRRKLARQALERVGLEGFMRYYPDQLSGGMKMRVSIARALVMRPRVLLMDEPFGALDEVTREAMNQEVHELCRDTGQTVVFVTHSIGEAAFLGTRIVMLAASPGRVAADIASPLPRSRPPELREREVYFEMVRDLRQRFRSLRGPTVGDPDAHPH
jgi:NitT/TauT family transport system ATP-binding protein